LDYVVPVILACPILIVLIGVLLIPFTKLKHKSYKASSILIIIYNILAYSSLFIERVLVIPFFMIVFRTYITKPEKINITGEIVTSTFKESWSVGHIIFSIYVLLSGICFCCIVILSWAFLSLTHYHSPLPWSDESVVIRISNFLIQILVSVYLVFDRDVI